MPTPDELKKQLQDSTSLQKSLGEIQDKFHAVNKNSGAITTDMENINSLSTSLNNIMKDTLTLQARIGKEYIKLSDIQRDINKFEAKRQDIEAKIQTHLSTATVTQRQNYETARKNQKSVIEFNKVIVEKAKEINKLQTDEADLQATIATLTAGSALHTQKTADLTALQNKLAAQILTKTRAQNIINGRSARLAVLQSDDMVRMLTTLGSQQDIADEFVQTLTQQLATQDAYNQTLDKSKNKLGSLAALMKGISKIPVLGNLIETDKVLKAMEDNFDKTGSKWKAFGAGMKATGEELTRLMKDPLVLASIWLGIMTKLVDAVFDYDKQLTDTANTLAISKASAQELYNHFYDVSVSTDKVVKDLDKSFLTISNQAKAMNGLNEQFGTMVRFTDKQIQSQIFLTDQMGMAADEAKSLQQYALLNKKTTMETVKGIVKQNDGTISYRKVISEVSKISGQLNAQYQNNPELIAKAVVQANKLGMSLEEAKKVSDSLLNFQSSIESELEAELLSGKALNLEKARSLALDGKSSEAAAEMLKQVGSYKDYMSKNVIVQQSLAKAVGMTADELSNSLREQQTLADLGFQNKDQLQKQLDLYKQQGDMAKYTALQEEIRSKANGDLLLSNMANVSLQQKFQQSVEKIKELFVQIASGPIMGMLNGIAKVLSSATAVKAILAGMVGIVTTLTALMIAAAFTINPIGAGIGLAAGGIAAAATYAMASSAGKNAETMHDGLINPDGGIQISTPRGMIIPDKNDSIIATTNPDGLLNPKNSSGNNKGVEDKLDTMIALLKRGGQVYMDSNKVGTSMGLSYSSYA